jgi:hypothetical protein
MLMEELESKQQSASFPLNLLIKSLKPSIVQANLWWNKIASGANLYKTPLINTLLELLFQLIQSSPNQSSSELSDQLLDALIDCNRCNHVLSAARALAVDFCVRSMQALTGTLFHFWLSKV